MIRSLLLLSLAAMASSATHAAPAAPLDVYTAGDIAQCSGAPASESAAAATARLIPPGATVLVLGDSVYPDATAVNYATCYGPTWGAHLEHTLAVPGNHDYVNGSSAGFHAYFGAGAGADNLGHFARRLGSWLLVGLDSSETSAGHDRQYAWLETTLAENRDARCVAAMWHKPVFSSGLHRGSGEQMRRFWKLLDEYGADIVLNGHEHYYEAFEPQDVEGVRKADGPREFIVGTGGVELRDFVHPPFQSRARIKRHGVLKLTLDAASYTWQFIDVTGRVADPGQASCRSKSDEAPGANLNAR